MASTWAFPLILFGKSQHLINHVEAVYSSWRARHGSPARCGEVLIALQIQFQQQIFYRDVVMSGDVLKNVRQGANLDWAVIWDGFVMLPVELGHDTNVATPLVVDRITELSQRFDQLVCADIARQLHSESTSSRTKCSRIIFGICSASWKWH